MTALLDRLQLRGAPLDERSRYLRRLAVRALDKGERGHIGSTMSLIEILRVLYDDILRFRPAEPAWPGRDRMILSKGHGCIALYVMKLSGPWRSVYIVTAMTSLYLNIFVLIIQAFLKVPALHALAPSVPPSEPPFAIVQGIVLVFFVLMIIGAWRRFRPAWGMNRELGRVRLVFPGNSRNSRRYRPHGLRLRKRGSRCKRDSRNSDRGSPR